MNNSFNNEQWINVYTMNKSPLLKQLIKFNVVEVVNNFMDIKIQKTPEDKIKDMLKTKQCIETIMGKQSGYKKFKKKSNKPNVFNNDSKIFVK